MSAWRHSLHPIAGGLLLSCVSLLFAQPLASESELGLSQAISPTQPLANLTDGYYQLCTEPPPDDWRDGDGVCLNVWKQGHWLDGYYGYPHSSRFVCLRGRISEAQLQGEGMVMSWAGHLWTDIPQTAFTWDDEARLTLDEWRVFHEEGVGEEQMRWIVFQTARLDLQKLYSYPSARMTPAAQLCDWRLDEN